MTRKEQKELRRQQILQTALDLFVQQGYYNTKTSQISRRAGISEGLLFHYFPTKENLLEELVKLGIMGMSLQVQIDAKNGLDFFYQFTVMLFEMVKNSPFIAQMFLFMAHTAYAPDIPEHIREMAASVDTIQNSCRMIETGQQDGSIRQGNVLTLSNMYWCSIQGIMEQFSQRADIPLPEPAWVVDMLRAAPDEKGLYRKGRDIK